MPKGTKRPKSPTSKSMVPWSTIGSEKDFHRAMNAPFTGRSAKPPSSGSKSGPWGMDSGTKAAIRSRAGMSGFKGPSVGRPKIPRERY